MNDTPLILASASPRRRELMALTGLPFTVDAPDVDESCSLPPREAVKELKKYGLFPCRRPAQCNMTTSFMTDRTDLVGRVFDKVYLNLHTPWGYAAMRILQKLR